MLDPACANTPCLLARRPPDHPHLVGMSNSDFLMIFGSFTFSLATRRWSRRDGRVLVGTSNSYFLMIFSFFRFFTLFLLFPGWDPSARHPFVHLFSGCFCPFGFPIGLPLLTRAIGHDHFFSRRLLPCLSCAVVGIFGSSHYWPNFYFLGLFVVSAPPYLYGHSRLNVGLWNANRLPRAGT